MHATILALETEVPKTYLPQHHFSSVTAKHLSLTDSQTNLLERISKGSQIGKRHTIIADFVESGLQGAFFGLDSSKPIPSTGKRNQVFKEAAPKLAESVCQKALEQWGGSRLAITHIISVSCTGMFAPGIEFLLIDRLGLSPHTERLGINFMGCFGAFKGLAVAKALALENPENRILLVCTELCSLHFQGDKQTDTLVANSIFADGTAAVVIGAQPNRQEKPLLELHNRRSFALKDTLDFMTWEVGDLGYQMRLSPLVPTQLEQNISSFTQALLGSELSMQACAWAVHPGGKSILQSIAKAFNLESEQLFASWNVLKEYGNMSSPTFLFVLKELLQNSCSKKWVIGLGFGPGLSVEGLMLKRVDANVAK